MAVMNEPAQQTELEAEDFGKRVKSAIFWRSGTQILAQAISWGATLAVIRILDPHDYGLFAMTQVVLVFLNFLNGHGFVGALVQSRDVEPIRIRQAFGLLLLLNMTLALLQVFVAAPLAADYYREPDIASIMRWQALIYLATPFLILPEAMMTRELEFRKPAIINLLTALVGCTVSIVMAMLGYGVWTLVVAPIAMFWSRAMMLTWTTRLLVWPSFDFRGSGTMFAFGMTMLASHGFWIVQSQSDIFIAGRQFNPHELGLYAEALFITQIFAAKFVPPLNEVAFPAYARMQHDPSALASSFLKAIRLIMLIACPLYLGMAISAGPFVETIMGPKWTGASPLVQILALAMPFMTLQILFAPAVNALGKPSLTMKASIVGAILMPITYSFTIQYGAVGLAAGWLIAMPLLLLFTAWQARPVIGYQMRDLFTAVMPGLGAALVMAVAVWLADRAIIASVWQDAPPLLHLLALTLAGGLTYVALLRFGARATFDEVLNLVLRRKAPAITP